MAGLLSGTGDLTTEKRSDADDTSFHGSDKSNDPFGSESHGTARYIGGNGSSSEELGGASSVLSGVGTLGNRADLQAMKGINNPASRVEMPRSELIKMLVYLEGELQARDVVIAALKNDRVKHLIGHLHPKPVKSTDPLAALFRDKIAIGGNLICRQSSTAAIQAEAEVKAIIEQQMEAFYQMVQKQRATHVRMVNKLTDSFDNNQRILQELEEEKRKHEHDTAQGDDITYGLEMERTKLRQELEAKCAQNESLEKEVKTLQETLEFERGRQKQIVLLLIAERKKILMKYIEEGKRSEDLAQILSEEKQRSDNIAEGLEEETKKSLRLEAEIEKQIVATELERKNVRVALAKEEKRIKELEAEVSQLKIENDSLKRSGVAPIRVQPVPNISGPAIPAKPRPLGDDSPSLANIAKIVQPTATVSSVPVSGPTTGIARSLSPGQTLRNPNILPSEQNTSTTAISTGHTPTKVAQPPTQQQPTLSSTTGQSAIVTHRTLQTTFTNDPGQWSQTVQSMPLACHTAAPISCTVLPNPATSSVSQLPTITPTVPGTVSSPGTTTTATTLSNVNINNILANVTVASIPAAPNIIPGTRGVPPPIPPNKPIIPHKREASSSRIGSLVASNSK